MLYLLTITPNARRDIQQAIDWEDERSPGLGIRIFLVISQNLDNIAAVPKMRSVRYQNIRCTHTETFPYIIHYYVDDEKRMVFVLRILSSKKKPTLE